MTSIAKAVVGVLFVCTASVANAVGWDVTPSVDVQLTHSDNVFRQIDDEKQDSFITVITPKISFGREGRYLSSENSYALSGVSYSNFSDENQLYHSLTSKTMYVLPSTGLSIGLDILFTQRFINAVVSDLNIISADPDAVENVATVKFFLSYTKALAGGRKLQLAYSLSQQKYFESSDLNSRTHALVGSISDDVPQKRFFWAVSGQYNRSDYLDSEKQDYLSQSGSGTLGYRLNSDVAFYVEGGVERYDFDVRENQESEFGYVGLRWSPTARLYVDLAKGRRTFGSSYRAEMAYASKRAKYTFNYNEDYSDFSQALLVLYEVPSTSEAQRSVALGIVNIQDVFVRKTAEMEFSYQLPKTLFQLSASSELRQYETLPFEEKIVGGELYIEWKFRPKHRLETRFSRFVNEQDLVISRQTETLSIANLAWVYRFKPEIDFSMGYRQTKNQSDIVLNDYTQNNIEWRVSARF